MSELATLSATFRATSEALRNLRDESFPRRCIVRYGSMYYLASIGDGCPPDKLPLIFENGNTWWKPVEECVRATDLRGLPRSVRRMKLQFHGYKLVYQFAPRKPLP